MSGDRNDRLQLVLRIHLCLLLAVAVCVVIAVPAHSLAPRDDIVRLHVVANSDAPSDQALKDEVRREVVGLTAGWLAGIEEATCARRVLRENLSELQDGVESVVQGRYSASVRMGIHSFPDTSYGESVTLPEGRYWAVQVILGRGEGDNWWCVLFPTLCVIGPADDGEAELPRESVSSSPVRSAVGEFLSRLRADDYVSALWASLNPAGHFHPPVKWLSSSRAR